MTVWTELQRSNTLEQSYFSSGDNKNAEVLRTQPSQFGKTGKENWTLPE